MTKISYKTCPLCSSESFHKYLDVKDFSVSGESFILKECEACHLIFTDNVPDESTIGPYYRSDSYISHTDKANNIINRLYKVARSFAIQNKLKLISILGGKQLLDVGCGTGIFLNAAYQNGYKINGIESDEIARSNQPQIVNDQCLKSISDLNSDHKYDIVTMWHVLEHIHDLTAQFKKVSDTIKPSGHIVIAVPNPASWDAKKYGSFWAGYDVPRHLYHFREDQIKDLFEEFNIKLIEIKPMWLDSFYVSMLSEKYKGSSSLSQIINGTVNGILSNFRAGKKNHSSLIYIGQKQ